MPSISCHSILIRMRFPMVKQLALGHSYEERYGRKDLGQERSILAFLGLKIEKRFSRLTSRIEGRFISKVFSSGPLYLKTWVKVKTGGVTF